MAVSWGSTFIGVTDSDPHKSHVLLADYRPTASSDVADKPCSERFELACEPEMRCFPRFDCEKEAANHVKEHILARTQQPILELVVAIEMAKMKIEELRIERPRTPDTVTAIASNKAQIDSMSEELKSLRALRRSSVEVK